MAAPPSVRDLLAAPGALVLPGVGDAFSARLAEGSGFRAVFVSGFAASVTRLARPDVGLLTQTEVLDGARRICAAVPSCAVVVDADTGYGNAFNAERTVEGLLRAGAAAASWRTRCGRSAAGTCAGSASCPRTSTCRSCARRCARARARRST